MWQWLWALSWLRAVAVGVSFPPPALLKLGSLGTSGVLQSKAATSGWIFGFSCICKAPAGSSEQNWHRLNFPRDSWRSCASESGIGHRSRCSTVLDTLKLGKLLWELFVRSCRWERRALALGSASPGSCGSERLWSGAQLGTAGDSCPR